MENQIEAAEQYYSLNRNKVILSVVLDVFVFALLLLVVFAGAIVIKKLEIFYMATIYFWIMFFMVPYSLVKGIITRAKTPAELAVVGQGLIVDGYTIPAEDLQTVFLPPSNYHQLVKMRIREKNGRRKTFYLGVNRRKGNSVFPQYQEFAQELEKMLLPYPGCLIMDF